MLRSVPLACVKSGVHGLIVVVLPHSAASTATGLTAPRPATTALYSTVLLRPPKNRPVTTLWSTKTGQQARGVVQEAGRRPAGSRGRPWGTRAGERRAAMGTRAGSGGRRRAATGAAGGGGRPWRTRAGSGGRWRWRRASGAGGQRAGAVPGCAGCSLARVKTALSTKGRAGLAAGPKLPPGMCAPVAELGVCWLWG